MNLQSQAIYAHEKNFKQRICILEDGASSEQVSDMEKSIVKNLFKL